MQKYHQLNHYRRIFNKNHIVHISYHQLHVITTAITNGTHRDGNVNLSWNRDKSNRSMGRKGWGMMVSLIVLIVTIIMF